MDLTCIQKPIEASNTRCHHAELTETKTKDKKHTNKKLLWREHHSSKVALGTISLLGLGLKLIVAKPIFNLGAFYRM